MPKGYDPLLGDHQQALRTNPVTYKEEPNPVSQTGKPPSPCPAQQDGHAGYWSRLSFPQCCKTQATLSANMENQDKTPASEAYVHGDNTEKTQRGSQKRPCEPEELPNEPMNCKLDFEVPER